MQPDVVANADALLKLEVMMYENPDLFHKWLTEALQGNGVKKYDFQQQWRGTPGVTRQDVQKRSSPEASSSAFQRSVVPRHVPAPVPDARGTDPSNSECADAGCQMKKEVKNDV